MIATNATTTMMAISPPFDRLKDPDCEPEAPASASILLADPVIPVPLSAVVEAAPVEELSCRLRAPAAANEIQPMMGRAWSLIIEPCCERQRRVLSERHGDGTTTYIYHCSW